MHLIGYTILSVEYQIHTDMLPVFSNSDHIKKNLCLFALSMFVGNIVKAVYFQADLVIQLIVAFNVYNH